MCKVLLGDGVESAEIWGGVCPATRGAEECPPNELSLEKHPGGQRERNAGGSVPASVSCEMLGVESRPARQSGVLSPRT